ncbi:MAG: glutamate-5-semialdehyde dehydrogenase [Candidatus Vesicomyosocius endoextente]|uniref:Gamma-glutamyl phosphate reductase n=1 Tax=Candidatus Vesicomyosocius endoextente TaxID=2738853 RepID=A0A853G570_9GAMM|nr:glutamate-5-semialdehyde dehydrogenase [Candidatus Vesicomyosocius endoextente]
MDSIKNLITLLGKNAKNAAKTLRSATTVAKNNALINIANQIDQNRTSILKANEKDLANSKNKGLNIALLDRLMLDNIRLNNIIKSLNQIVNLADPIGEITDLKYQVSGIQVGKMRVSLGVIGVIYESRPNVTIDAVALCLKSGNSIILRGGSETVHSNHALYTCVKQSIIQAGLNENCAQLINTQDRKAVIELVKASDYVDAIIPRGGKGLLKAISNSAKVPIIKHLDGICHTYIDKDADTQKAISIAFNAKTRRYGVCNATETLLVHRSVVDKILPKLITQYLAKGVELRGCSKTVKLSNRIISATKEDWKTEYLDAILSIRIVDSMSEAIKHIDKYSSNHTESIVSENYTRSRRFITEVNSSSVMINASTCFADGFEYGLGGEIGISTDKLHVRGPVGLEGLTSQKFIVLGDGHIRQ